MQTANKKIFYCAVSRGGDILAEYTESRGTSYRTFTEGVLKKVKTGKHVLEFK